MADEAEIQALYERLEALERGLDHLVLVLGCLSDTLGGTATRIASGLTRVAPREPAEVVA